MKPEIYGNRQGIEPSYDYDPASPRVTIRYERRRQAAGGGPEPVPEVRGGLRGRECTVERLSRIESLTPRLHPLRSPNDPGFG
jgi:hypothetical protein